VAVLVVVLVDMQGQERLELAEVVLALLEQVVLEVVVVERKPQMQLVLAVVGVLVCLGKELLELVALTMLEAVEALAVLAVARQALAVVAQVAHMVAVVEVRELAPLMLHMESGLFASFGPATLVHSHQLVQGIYHEPVY
jgi:hypothetical protein